MRPGRVPEGLAVAELEWPHFSATFDRWLAAELMAFRVFVVEDHHLMREMLSEFVENAPGLEVCGIASTGGEALEMVQHVDPELMLVDVSLPDMSGIEVVEKVKEWNPELPCLMLSGHQEKTYVRRALDAGASGYLVKGNPHEIIQAIEEAASGNTYLGSSLRRPGPHGDAYRGRND